MLKEQLYYIIALPSWHAITKEIDKIIDDKCILEDINGIIDELREDIDDVESEILFETAKSIKEYITRQL